jgi:phage terminase small subunit
MANYKCPLPNRPLSQPERKVLDYYLANPTCLRRDAFLAGYPGRKDASRNVQNTQANAVFNRASFRHELERRTGITTELAASERERVLIEFRKIAYTDLPGIIEFKNGCIGLHDFDDMTPEQRACVKEIRVKTTKEIREAGERVPISIIEIKLHDKLAALTAIGKAISMFTDRVEVEHHVEAAAAVTPEMVLRDLMDRATPEEFEMLRAMAERLHVEGLKSCANEL